LPPMSVSSRRTARWSPGASTARSGPPTAVTPPPRPPTGRSWAAAP